MAKQLTDMSLKELWELFPVALVEHDEGWEASYRAMERRLREILAKVPDVRISHIGSTAIPGIQAKDIVDVLVEVPESCDLEEVARAIEAGGLTRMSTGTKRVSFNLGYTPNGFADEVFHVHLRYVGDNDELYFRDYLRDHPQVAKEYEALKLHLAKRFEHDRDGYTDAKSDFIRQWTDIAKAENQEDISALCKAVTEDDGVRYSQDEVLRELGF